MLEIFLLQRPPHRQTVAMLSARTPEDWGKGGQKGNPWKMTSLPPQRVDGNFAVPNAQRPMSFTGERLTSEVGGQIEYEHYHRYCIARDFCFDCDVLDVASGEGYGTALLAGVARNALGVDIDSEAVEHANASYVRPNLSYVKGDVLALPIADASVDRVVSFETLEHVADHTKFIEEVQRVLRPDGLLIISTPDRLVYSAPGTEPNPFHFIELTHDEFHLFLEENFKNTYIMRQRSVSGSVIIGDDRAGWRTYERRSEAIIEATSGLARAHYLLGFASDSPILTPPSSSYLDWSISSEVLNRERQYKEATTEYQRVVDERGERISALERLLDDKAAEHKLILDERDRQLSELKTLLFDRIASVDEQIQRVALLSETSEKGLKLVELLERLVAKQVLKFNDQPVVNS